MDLVRPTSPTDEADGPAEALPDAAVRAVAEHRRVLAQLLVTMVLLLPLNVGWVLWTAPGGDTDYNRRITIAPFDFALGGLVLVWIAHCRLRWRHAARPATARRRPTAGVILAAAFAVVFTVSFVAHPSWRGVEYALRLFAAAAVIDTVRTLAPAARRRVCIALVAAGAFEAVLAIAQSVHGRGFALYPIDQAGPLFSFGGRHAGRGGLSHPYHLAVFLLLALLAAVIAGRDTTGRERRLWMLGATCLGAGLGVTFSRAMVLAVVPVGALWAIEHRRLIGRAVRPILAAFALGLVVAGVMFASGWTERVAQSAGSGADRGRAALARAGLEMASNEPITGVGPARYVLALDEPGPPDGELLPAHNLVVHAAAELGIGGAVIVSVIGLWFARRTTRRGLLAGGALWLLTPFFMLDAYTYVFPTGLALTAIWLGMLESRGVDLHPRTDAA